MPFVFLRIYLLVAFFISTAAGSAAIHQNLFIFENFPLT
jgi:hypothetical protein